MPSAKRPICMTIYGCINYGLLANTTTRLLMEQLKKQMTTENCKVLKNTQWTLYLGLKLISTYCKRTLNKAARI